MNYKIREVGQLDVSFLWKMLYQCLYVREGEKPFPIEILQTPEISKYASQWGRNGDLGLIAEDPGNTPLGIVWLRLFDFTHKGYGFVDEKTPELSISVDKDYRGQGIGSALLREIEIKAKNFGYKSISLSVDPNNPARRLYEKLCYTQVGWCGTSLTMKKDLI
ncbi:GNAT family N-acetyltransferase [Sporolactobacillus laevolacticus]|uniref:GNAT family N-acetyltransferase n=1 Tax=Sporolactobacillus laevolacticus TaxID=33018 RepID=UPI0025B2F6DE|nr:GNAT family N-acetyltransferase [Sporolactobacillus laevolacticus]MDN3956028.1 GNAT family N-acetyltransferase [Sporolactobacillus laevolacticus]